MCSVYLCICMTVSGDIPFLDICWNMVEHSRRFHYWISQEGSGSNRKVQEGYRAFQKEEHSISHGHPIISSFQKYMRTSVVQLSSSSSLLGFPLQSCKTVACLYSHQSLYISTLISFLYTLVSSCCCIGWLVAVLQCCPNNDAQEAIEDFYQRHSGAPQKHELKAFKSLNFRSR